MTTIGIIGAGAWGCAVAKILTENGHDVTLWCLENEVADEINLEHRNTRFLPGVLLPQALLAVTDPQKASDGKDVIILAVPSLYLLDVVRRLLNSNSVKEGHPLIVVLTKGFVPTSKGPRLIVETLEDYLPGFYRDKIVYVSGPSQAEEVSRGLVTGLIAACGNGRNAIKVRELLRSRSLLIFPSLDIVGVQVCGAVKNVIAIAFGILDAVKAGSSVFGDNTESMLLAAGLNEIQSLGVALGSTHPETYSSISGVGDLDVTCRSIYGRNRRFGREIVEKNLIAGFTGIDDLIAKINQIGYLPEGVFACKYVKILAEERKVSMPISAGVYKILDRQIDPSSFLDEFIKVLAG